LNRVVVVGIIFLFVASSVIPIYGFNIEQLNILSSDGNTLYVGGSGEGNYTKIQDAIDNASNGDTVFVYSGTYYENVDLMLKSISLIGEEKNTTVIDAKGIGTAISIDRFNYLSTIRGFTIQNSGSEEFASGIFISEVHGVIITNNIVVANNIGIYLYNTRDCQIRNNNIIRNKGGIFGTGASIKQVYYCYNTTLTGNYISDNDFGIAYAFNRNGMISGNIITNNGIGFVYYICNYNMICTGNNISNNNVGLNSIHGLTVVQNNFINNTQHVKLRGFHSFFMNIYNSTWKRNYWGKPRKLPYPIPVRIGFHGLIPWFPQFDWNPAQEPYDI